MLFRSKNAKSQEEAGVALYEISVQAVRDVNFYLNEQETLAVVGESGSGKSITMKGIMGILPKNGKVTEGTVMYNGKDLTKYTEREMQSIRGSEIALVFQDPMTSLNPTMRIGKQIEEMLKAHKMDMTAEQRKARAIELLSLVGISNPEQRYKQYPHQLSGGMRQRVVIAIALACDPKVLIADEPTTALDVTIQAQILDLMRDLQKKTKTSIIIITHNLGVVANIADRVAVMYGGKLVETGDVYEIFKNPCDCVVFEDIPAGIMAGKAAGMTVFAVEDEFSEPLREKKLALADGWVRDYTELI